MTYGNCLLFALRQWVTWGGYIVTRKSHHGWWPHFMWSPDLVEFWEFVPPYHTEGMKSPPLVFKGLVKGFCRVST